MKLEPLEPEERIMTEPTIIEQINTLVQKLNWETDDDIAVEVGGTSIYEIDGAGTKWAPVKGTRKYNKDAFIIIKNRSRNPTVPSIPNPDLKGHHNKTEKELAAEIKRSDDAKNYDTYSK
tara:strand:+ start:131 stop:490 length:360 start_codon:yes stop_codon:yes gene_type:complete